MKISRLFLAFFISSLFSFNVKSMDSASTNASIVNLLNASNNEFQPIAPSIPNPFSLPSIVTALTQEDAPQYITPPANTPNPLPLPSTVIDLTQEDDAPKKTLKENMKIFTGKWNIHKKEKISTDPYSLIEHKAPNKPYSVWIGSVGSEQTNCSYCPFKAKTSPGLSSHIRNKHKE